jgi:hypothetical protein
MKTRYALPLALALAVANIIPARADYQCTATCMCDGNLREATRSCRGGDNKLTQDCAAVEACRYCDAPGHGIVIRLHCDFISPTPPLPIEEFW